LSALRSQTDLATCRLALVHRRIILMIVATALALATVAQARVGAGTYSGTSTYKVEGTKAIHPFTLTVKHGKVVKVSFFGGGFCGDLDDQSGSGAKIPIHGNTINGTVKFATGSKVTIKGRFSGSRVKGTLTGTIRAGTSHCSMLKSSFSAHRG
jgi:hypothetical protein